MQTICSRHMAFNKESLLGYNEDSIQAQDHLGYTLIYLLAIS